MDLATTPLPLVWAVFLLSVALPIVVVLAVLRITQSHLPDNFFVYVLAVAFAGSALSLAAAGLGSAAVIAGSGAMSAATIFGDFAPYLLYLAFAEGTMTGMLVTLAVVYRPDWLATFDDARYLHHK